MSLSDDQLDTGAFDALLLTVFPGDHVFAVGGRVRDELRAASGQAQLTLKDADYVVTGQSYESISHALMPHGRVDKVGSSFSVIKLTRDGQTVDIATPRREISTGTGHRDFIVEAGPDIPLVDDLARRDFRMNMIARSIASGEMIDPFAGAADIAASRIDMLHSRTFIEDPLRMLRACQFAARFEYVLTPSTHAAISAAHGLIETVSPQRIGEEFAKLLERSAKPSIGFELMRTTKLLFTLWPELEEGYGIEQNDWHVYDVYRHNLETLDAMPARDMIARLAALLHDVGKPRVKDGPHFYRHELVGAEIACEMLRRVGFSNEVIETTTHLVRHHMFSSDPIQTDAAIRRFIKRVEPRHLSRLFALRAADICGSGLPKRNGDNEAFEARVTAELRNAPAIQITDLKVTGQDVIDAYIAAGAPPAFRGDRRVGAILRELLDIVVETPASNSRTNLLTCITRIIASQ